MSLIMYIPWTFLSILFLVSCSHSSQDAVISRAVTTRFIEYRPVNLQRIDVYVEDGTVYLSGEVENREEEAQARRIAGSVRGVKRVVNKLQVIP